MTISAKIVADSIGKLAPRITTMELKYPRFIHQEVMTHRAFSRNAASSRAIPAKELRRRIMDDPAIPIHWGKNQKGMQASTEASGFVIFFAKMVWLGAMHLALAAHRLLELLGIHKQICNRIVEPWMHMEVVVTATEWDNFYNLRNHPDAQPEIQALALAMLDAHNNSTPKVLEEGGWHLPYWTDKDNQRLLPELKAKICTARCARVSYLKHNGQRPSPEEDLKLYQRLMGGSVDHASPSEHIACLMSNVGTSNLRGWQQFRKMVERPMKPHVGLVHYNSEGGINHGHYKIFRTIP